MKVVFDTNIFISAFAFPGGRADGAMRLVIEGRASLLISKPIIHEVLNVMSRKFEGSGEELARIAVYLADLGQMVHPRRQINVLSDEPDNRILECALTGKAEFIVTGDKAMLRLKKYEGVEIVTLSKFLS